MEETAFRARELCLEQARGFVAAADQLNRDSRFTHIAYHLALLALEEIGKAGMIAARAVTKRYRDDSWIDKSLDNHVRKLHWAIWSPIARIDPRDFESARELAERVHGRRLSSLYVDAQEAAVASNEPITSQETAAVLDLARTRLELEDSSDQPEPDNDGLIEWFLNVMSDELRSRRLLSKPFIDRYSELGANARAWIVWARDEFARLDLEAVEALQAELIRTATPIEKRRPRWEADVTVYSSSHSLRPKMLARWNERIPVVELIWLGKKDQLTLRVMLNDDVLVSEVAGRAISLAKLTVACLNLGTIGYFWFEPPGFERAWFKEIRDSDRQEMLLSINQPESFWGTGRSVALTEQHIDHATRCMLAFALLSERDAEAIFKPYLDGLALVAKSDIFYSFDEIARRAFATTLRAALRHFGGWNGEQDSFRAAFNSAFLPFMPDSEDRDQIYGALTPEGMTGSSRLENLRSAKQLADLYLVHIANVEWQRRINVRLSSNSGQTSE